MYTSCLRAGTPREAHIVLGKHCVRGLEYGLTLKYGVKFEVVLQIKTFGQPACAKKRTHAHEEERKGIGRGGRVSFTSNFDTEDFFLSGVPAKRSQHFKATYDRQHC